MSTFAIVDFSEFILQHSADDPAGLALSRDRFRDFPEFDLALCTLEARRKLRGKLPSWLEVPSLHFPYTLAAEQCSSEETAAYKAMLLTSPGDMHSSLCSIADLTGGLGVDSWAFAKAGLEVLYNDMRPELVEAARHNFAELGIRNVRFSCAEVKSGSIDTILGDFKADAVFLDPARRDSAGGKVFRIADCSPDVTALLPELFSHVRFVLVKLSPMLDISLGAAELGRCVREVHCVGAAGECKELLFLLDREHDGDYGITVYEDGGRFSFNPSDEAGSVACYSPSCEAGSWLFAPGKALLKSGCFKLISQRFGLAKVGVNAHFYLADDTLAELGPLGKWFRVLEAVPLDKRGIRDIGRRYPGADVTARGVHISSEELKKRLGSASGSGSAAGGAVHVFAVHHDSSGKNLLIVAGS